MNTFTLDTRLQQDTIKLGVFNNQILLLMNNALVPWFILVPITDKNEIYLLDEQEQLITLNNTNQLSKHLMNHFPVQKINVGAIGNIVNQLHIHVIGRDSTDFAWPNVVWGKAEKQPYEADRVKAIVNNLLADPEIVGFNPNGV